MIYTFKYPEDYNHKLIGVYDKESGDSPHDLKAFRNPTNWIPPKVYFEVSEAKVDAIPSVNMPLFLVRNDLSCKIKEIAEDYLKVLPIKTYFKHNESNNYSVVFPTESIEIWDLDISEWKPLTVGRWPKEKPFYYYNMVLIDALESSIPIGYNIHDSSMLLFNEEIKNIIRQHSKWVTTFVPQNYRRA